MEILVTKDFARRVKRLSKKYKSIKSDLQLFVSSLENNPEQGVLLANGFRKIRMSITSKSQGKSGGARVITLNILRDKHTNKIVLVTIYDKSEQQNITEQQIVEAYNTL